MAKTIVGMFEQMKDAQQAMNDIQAAGISDNATFAPQGEPQLHTRLSDAGIPKEDAELYANGVKQGYPMIVVQGVADDDAEQVAAILDRRNVMDISRLSQNYQRRSLERTTASTAGTNVQANLYEGQDVVVPIIEEQIKIGKRKVAGGGVRIRTSVEERPVNEQVSLHSETVHVDRQTVDRAVDGSAFDQFKEQSFEMRETNEEAVVSKAVHVVEEVRVKKDAADRTETISDTVRRTNVDVEQVTGDVRAVGETTRASTTETRTVTGTPTTTVTTTGEPATSVTTTENTEQKGLFSRAWNAVERATGMDADSNDSERGGRKNS